MNPGETKLVYRPRDAAEANPPPFGTANEKPLQPEPPAGGNKE